MGRKFYDAESDVQGMLQKNENFKRVMKLSNADIANMNNSECIKAIEKYNKIKGW